jgi:hypothetical protein
MVVSIQTAAQPKEKTLKGYLGVEGGESFVYQLIFTDSLGYIKGHSYTWLYEKSEVQAAITGYIDKKNKTFSFKENIILYNRGFQSNTTICLINALLRYKQEDGNLVFTGPITSSDITNVSCGRGTITFQDNEVLRSLFNNTPDEAVPPPKQTLPKTQKAMRIVYDTVSTPKKATSQTSPNEPATARITEGMEKAYEWTTDTIIVDLWDGGRIDGDIVTVLYNNVPALDKYTVVKEPKRLKFLLTGKSLEVITIVAEHEGNEALNTANVLLTDGKIQYPVEVYNTIGKKAMIKIRRASSTRK